MCDKATCDGASCKRVACEGNVCVMDPDECDRDTCVGGVCKVFNGAAYQEGMWSSCMCERATCEGSKFMRQSSV